MSFAIFLGLNDLSETIEKIFVGAGGAVTRPFKAISRGAPWHRPPLQICFHIYIGLVFFSSFPESSRVTSRRCRCCRLTPPPAASSAVALHVRGHFRPRAPSRARPAASFLRLPRPPPACLCSPPCRTRASSAAHRCAHLAPAIRISSAPDLS